MNLVFDILNSHPGRRIVETGCSDTLDIAKWIDEMSPNCQFECIDLDGRLQESVHNKLEADGVAQYCTFHTQIPSKFLAAQTWIDVAFLKPPDLQSGLDEFCFAISAGASLVVMRDYQTRAALAVQKAKAIGWNVTHQDPYSILRRP